MREFVRKIDVAVVIGLAIVAFFSTYKLTESPTTWMDEGIITQVARNMARSGKSELQIAPREFVSAGFVTTGYPVTFPVAFSMRIFGEGLLPARAVMAAYLILFYFAAVALVSDEKNKWARAGALLLVATFAPLYGDGKNVLGEIPGMFFLLLGLWHVRRIEQGDVRVRSFFFAALLFGLVVATKPIFILLTPALALGAWMLRAKLDARRVLASALGFALPMALWLFVQFTHDSLSNILSIYANPHSTDFAVSLRENFLRFFHESTPLYTTITMLAWIVSVAVRKVKKIEVPVFEWIALTFSLFVLAAYLRTVGYYRYFLEAELLSLIFFARSLESVFKKKVLRRAAAALVVALVIFQAYQLVGNSWVADFYQSRRTAALDRAVSSLGDSGVFVYKAPEAVIFLKSDNYEQYMEVTKTISVGIGELGSLSAARQPFVVTLGEFYDAGDPLLTRYELLTRADRYVILRRK